MAGLSSWSAKELNQCPESVDGPPRVMYCQNRQEVEEYGKEILSVRDSVTYDDSFVSPKRGSAGTDGNQLPFQQSENAESSYRSNFREALENFQEEKKEKKKKRPIVQSLHDFLNLFSSKPVAAPVDPPYLSPIGSATPPNNSNLDNYNLDTFKNVYQLDFKNYRYALVFGIITEFNPSGVWVIEEYSDIREEL